MQFCTTTFFRNATSFTIVASFGLRLIVTILFYFCVLPRNGIPHRFNNYEIQFFLQQISKKTHPVLRCGGSCGGRRSICGCSVSGRSWRRMPVFGSGLNMIMMSLVVKKAALRKTVIPLRGRARIGKVLWSKRGVVVRKRVTYNYICVTFFGEAGLVRCNFLQSCVWLSSAKRYLASFREAVPDFLARSDFLNYQN